MEIVYFFRKLPLEQLNFKILPLWQFSSPENITNNLAAIYYDKSVFVIHLFYKKLLQQKYFIENRSLEFQMNHQNYHFDG